MLAAMGLLVTALLVTAALAATDAPTPAGEEAAPARAGARRPRTCLVLSGGAARGAAHVGVLQALEDLHVPVDCVAGTSMGAVVGGLYAAGIGPRQLGALLGAVDWDDLFEDAAPRRLRPYRRQQDEYGTLVVPTLGLRAGRVSLPPGLVQGHQLDWLLRSLTVSASGTDDFDRLPIPFRAAATDGATGAAVVLARGDLAAAIRASMAIPGVFRPGQSGDRVLVDGAFTSNLPVAAARDMGAEVVIAVDIGPRPRPGALQDLARIGPLADTLGGLAAEANVAASRASLGPDDVLLDPELGDLTLLDFGRYHEALAAGTRAVVARAAELRRLAVDEAAWEAWTSRVRPRPRPPPLVSRVTIANETPVPDARLARRVESRPGPLDLALLHQDLDRLQALGEFDLVSFELAPGEGGEELRIVPRDRSWGRTSLRFGLEVGTDLAGRSAYAVRARLSGTSVGGLGAEWRLVGAVGQTTELTGEWYQPLLPSGLVFLAPGGGYRSVVIGDAAAVDYRTWTLLAHLDAGLALADGAEVRVGIERGIQRGGALAPSATPDLRSDRAGVAVRVRLDRLDDLAFPRHGAALWSELRFELPELGASAAGGAAARFTRLSVSGVAAGTLARHTLQLSARAGSALGTALPFQESFALGGFRNLSAWREWQLGGAYSGFSSLAYLFRLARLPPFVGRGVFAGASVEVGGVWRTAGAIAAHDLHGSLLAFLGAETLLGPVNVGYALGGQGRSRLYVNVGWSLGE